MVDYHNAIRLDDPLSKVPLNMYYSTAPIIWSNGTNSWLAGQSGIENQDTAIGDLPLYPQKLALI
jgi:hypothetical protein